MVTELVKKRITIMEANFWHGYNFIIDSIEKARLNRRGNGRKHALLWLTVRLRRVRGMPTSNGNFH